MRVCAKLNIPFLECDAEEEYKKYVADYMIEEYRKGRTPNPDVFCNREIKFGVFWKFAKTRGADYIATGHYARADGTNLLKGKDSSKDQSYFLWTLTKDDLEHVLFPIGEMHKSDVRILAKKYGLDTAEKKDSQGICMLGELDIDEFLSHYIKHEEGNVLNTEGEVIGTHSGAAFLTIGERKGFTITEKTPSDAPLYILSKDMEKNTITVSPDKDDTSTAVTDIALEKSNLGNLLDKKYTAQIRYRGEYLPCRVEGTVVSFENPVHVAQGQSIVIYDGDVCLGGGVVR